MKLYLIRHGMTDANEKRLYCGQTDVPLNASGINSLSELKKTLNYPKADLYISSDLTRAIETMRILYDREPDVTYAEFRELDLGEFEMKSHDELKDLEVYQRWIEATEAVTCPGGESKPEFDGRVLSGLGKLKELNIDSAVVICHGGVIVSIMEKMFPGQKNFYEWQPLHGRGYILEIYQGSAVLKGDI